MDADLPKNFTFFAANFKWAGLQFPGLINGSAFEKHAGVQKQAAGAGKYLNAIKSSAEQLFLSSLIVQLIVAVVIVGFHLLLNFIIKKKLKKVPNALAFPKFELGHLLAVYESITQVRPPARAYFRPPPPNQRRQGLTGLGPQEPSCRLTSSPSHCVTRRHV